LTELGVSCLELNKHLAGQQSESMP
jgi:hypothetical protein